MKRLLSWSMCLGLMVLPAMAGTGPDDNKAAKDKTTAAATTTTTATTTPTTKATTTTPAQPGDAAKPAANSNTTSSNAGIEAELQQMKALLEAQAAQLAAQQEELESLRSQMNAAPRVMSAGTTNAGATSPGTLDGTASGVASTPAVINAVKGYGSDDVENPQDLSNANKENKSPLSFKIGDAQFTPGGFLDLTTYFRSTNVGSGIGTSFGSIPYNNTVPGGGLTETGFSAQNSRISLRVDSEVAGAKVVGYTEADFLGNAPTNLLVTSNSDTFRLRVYFVDARWGKWDILGGQDWSLLTPNRKGIGFMPADVFYSQDMDTNYQVGLTWARQAQFRMTYHPTDNWAMALSVENPDQYTGSAVTFPSLFSSAQVNNGSNGTVTPNAFPDIIVKLAHDSNVNGKNWHIEAAGVATNTKLYTPASVTGTNSSNNSKEGGGVSVNMNLEVAQGFHLIANTFWSDGAGRYIFGLGPNFIVNQNGSVTAPFIPSLIHAGSGVGGFEWTLHKSLFYGYYGGAYYGRDYSLDPNKPGTLVGYGYSGSANSNNRAIQEGTIGVIQSLWKSPTHGALQIITQGSYLTRAPWFVAAGTPKNAHLGMAYVDLRYVLP